MKPITPSEVAERKAELLPDGVIEAFNDLVAKCWTGTQARVTQGAAVAAVCQKMECSRDTVFANKWLDVEDAFRQAGWRVEYDKPGFNESYEAFFVFRPGK